MNTPTLAVYCFGHNLSKIRYPYIASLESALELVGSRGAVFYAECDSDPDDTAWDDISALRRKHPNLVTLKHAWGTHHTIQAHIANFLLDSIGVNYDYALKLDMDEVLHEKSFSFFRQDMNHMRDKETLLARPYYTHFCPDDKTVFPFIYDSKAVISKTTSFFRYRTDKGGDACALGGAPEFQTQLEVYHYGKMSMGREKESLFKEHEFQKLYTELGFPDPKVEAQLGQGYLDYMKVFDVALGNREFSAFVENHPKFVTGWLAEQRERHELLKQSIGL